LTGERDDLQKRLDFHFGHAVESWKQEVADLEADRAESDAERSLAVARAEGAEAEVELLMRKLAEGWDKTVAADKARAIRAEIRAEEAEAELNKLLGLVTDWMYDSGHSGATALMNYMVARTPSNG